MLNAVKRHHGAAGTADRAPEGAALRRVRCQAVGLVLALIALAFALPGPGSWATAVTATSSQGSANAATAVGQALLTAVAMLVWGLLAWCGLLVGTLCWARIPGGAGHVGRALLARLAPLSAVRVLTAAMGLSLLAGVGACGAPLATAQGASTSAPSTTSTPTSTSAVPNSDSPSMEPSGAAPSAAIAVDIDWPSDASSADPATAAVPSDPSTPAIGTGEVGDPPGTPASTDVGARLERARQDATDAPRSSEPSRASSLVALPAVPSTAAAVLPSSHVPPQQPTSPTVTSVFPDDPTPPPTDRTQVRAPSDRTTSGPATARDTSGRQPVVTTATAAHSVTVRPGDSLWSIAQRALPQPATDDAIDSAWRAWYVTNLPVIGDDPDLIRPGQVLFPPMTKVG